MGLQITYRFVFSVHPSRHSKCRAAHPLWPSGCGPSLLASDKALCSASPPTALPPQCSGPSLAEVHCVGTARLGALLLDHAVLLPQRGHLDHPAHEGLWSMGGSERGQHLPTENNRLEVCRSAVQPVLHRWEGSAAGRVPGLPPRRVGSLITWKGAHAEEPEMEAMASTARRQLRSISS